MYTKIRSFYSECSNDLECFYLVIYTKLKLRNFLIKIQYFKLV